MGLMAGYGIQLWPILQDVHSSARSTRGDYTKVTYLHGKGERIANVTRQVGS